MAVAVIGWSLQVRLLSGPCSSVVLENRWWKECWRISTKACCRSGSVLWLCYRDCWETGTPRTKHGCSVHWWEWVQRSLGFLNWRYWLCGKWDQRSWLWNWLNRRSRWQQCDQYIAFCTYLLCRRWYNGSFRCEGQFSFVIVFKKGIDRIVYSGG